MAKTAFLNRRRLLLIIISILLVFVIAIAYYASWANLRFKEQVRAQLLERARLLASQYIEYEGLRPFIMRRAKEEVLYQVKLVSLDLIIGIAQPDNFEIESLQKFAQDKKLTEIYQDEVIMGREVFRYLKPFKIGGAEAAVSLKISKESLLSAYRENIMSILLFSGSMIFFTLLLTSVLFFLLGRMALELDDTNQALARLQAFKEELTRLLVHDLKNPLAGVIESLSIIKEGLVGQLTEDQRTLVNNAKNAADRLLLMISNILDISRLEEGKLELKRQPLELKTFLEKAVKKNAELAQREGKSVTLVSAFSEPKIQADEGILERVLDNLISNSLKHTLANQGKVEVTAVLNEPERSAQVAVRDNGEGIPPEYLEKVFDKFVQVESRKLGTKLDTGLGLTFCRLAVNAHGGRIWVESPSTPSMGLGTSSLGTGVVGKGSTFYFTIPV